MTKTKILTTNAEAPQSQRQSDSTANTQPTKTVTTVANDKANEREELRTKGIRDLKYHIRCAGSCLDCIEGEDRKFIYETLSELESMEVILESGDLGGSYDE